MAELEGKWTVVKGYYRKDDVYVGAHIRNLASKNSNLTKKKGAP